jgi:hypothetical protein
MTEAVAEARRALSISNSAENQYRCGCILALASTKDPALQKESIKLLASALGRDWGHDKIEKDTDLDPLRKTLEFKYLLGFSRLSRNLPGNSQQ